MSEELQAVDEAPSDAASSSSPPRVYPSQIDGLGLTQSENRRNPADEYFNFEQEFSRWSQKAAFDGNERLHLLAMHAEDQGMLRALRGRGPLLVDPTYFYYVERQTDIRQLYRPKNDRARQITFASLIVMAACMFFFIVIAMAMTGNQGAAVPTTAESDCAKGLDPIAVAALCPDEASP